MNQDNSLFFDTNIFLRLLVPENPTAVEECTKLIELVNVGEISVVISPLIIAEVVWVLEHYYSQPKEKVCGSVEAIQSLSGISVCQDIQMGIALSLYQAHNVKYIAATIASIPQILSGKIPVVSYDTDFGKLPVRWLTPTQCLGKIA